MPEHATPRGPVDGTRVPRFAGPATFARLPRIDEVSDVDVAVVGVPFDAGVSYRPGARFGPAHVRESSRLLRPYNPAAGADARRLRGHRPTPAVRRLARCTEALWSSTTSGIGASLAGTPRGPSGPNT